MRDRAFFALAVLFAINTMNFFDRQILGAVGEAVRKEWTLDDASLGALGTAFTLLYAFVGVPLGRLVDRTERKWILGAGVFAWSLLTALSGFTRSFWQLFAVRLGIGIGEATCSPAASSLIGDLFPAARRGRAMAIFMLGLPLGVALSYAVSAWVAQEWGWRAAFYVAGAPGLLCALAVLWIQEPPRGQTEAHAIGARHRPGSPFRVILSIPTMWWFIASGALHNFNMYALGSFLSPFLIRYHHVSLRDAGLIAMVTYGLSGAFGLLVGGAAADALYRRRVDGRMLVSTASLVIATPLMYLSLSRPAGDVVGFAVLMGLGTGVMYAYYSTVYSTIHDVVEPSLRGTAMAIYFFAMYVLGASFGPLGTGLASDHFTRKAAAAAGVLEPTRAALEPFRAEGLHSAMHVIPVLGVLLILVLFAASRTVGRDVARLEEWMRSEGGAAHG